MQRHWRSDGQGETDGQSWLASKPRSHSPFSTLHPFPWDVVRAEIPLPTLGRVMFVLGSPGNPIPLCEYSWPQYWSKRPVCVCVCVCVCIKLIKIALGGWYEDFCLIAMTILWLQDDKSENEKNLQFRKEEQKGKKRLGSWRISLGLRLALDPQILSLLMKRDNKCVFNLRYYWMSFNRKHSWCQGTVGVFSRSMNLVNHQGSEKEVIYSSWRWRRGLRETRSRWQLWVKSKRIASSFSFFGWGWND